MSEPNLTSIIFTSAALVGLLVSFFGALVSASHTYSIDRKKIPPLLDLIDFVLLVITSSFSGFIGFLLASFWLTDETIILAVTGLSAIAGYSLLINIKDIFLDVLRSKLMAHAKTDSTEAFTKEDNPK